MKEVISIHLGQAGVNVGDYNWELFCLEHCISNQGELKGDPTKNDQDSLLSFFSETKTGKFVPRSLFIDLEPTSINEIKTGLHKELYDPDTLLTGKSDAANNFARGYCTLGKDLINLTIDKIRKKVEECTNLQGFMIYSSASGGTGSGFGSLLLERLSVEFPHKNRINHLIYPSLELSNTVVEPYNCLLSNHSQLEISDLTFIYDNEAVYDICRRQLEIEIPMYKDLNCIISQVNSSITASMRFDGSLNKDMDELKNNLVPFPRLHFILSSYSPFINSTKSFQESLSTAHITNNLFEPSYTLTKCDPRLGKYMSCCLMFRGDIASKDIMAAVATIKTKRTIKFVDWSPAGFKCGLNYQPPITIPGDILSKTIRAGCMFGNSTSILQVFSRMNHKFDLMFNKRAFLHWYLAEGMEEEEFRSARENMAALEKDYEEVALDADEIEEEEEV